jgi:Peptidase A4 family
VADAAYSHNCQFAASGGKHVGGWGRGGYTMMPGGSKASPAGQGSGTSQGSAPGASAGAITTEATQTSQNWAGYAAAGQPGTFTSVAASWTQPTVTCGATQTFSSFWVGLDGDGTASVEQTGSEADCDGGTAAYSGWFEMFPAAPVFYNQPVQPGDAMSASVTANGNGSFTLTLADTTQGWTQPTTQTSNTAQLGSAEVIAEAPSNGESVLPLSDFGTVNFTSATANNQPIADANPDELIMASQAAGTEATPTVLTGGNAFSVAFNGGTGQGGGTGDGGTSPTPTATATTSRHHRRHHG